MKKVRSLKTEVPPAEELALACEQIVQKITSFDPGRNKIQTIYSSAAAEQHGEEVIGQITSLLRAHKRPEPSVVGIYNLVTMACPLIPEPTTSPATKDEFTGEVAATAGKLLRLLGNPERPQHHIFRVFGYVDRWNEFIERL